MTTKTKLNVKRKATKMKAKETYGIRAIAKYKVKKNVSYPDIPGDCRCLKYISGSNTYGGYGGPDSSWERTYICHAGFSSNTIRENIWTTAVYRGEKTEAQREYFEYISSPITSPWRDLLKVLDYTITRNNKGWITGVIVHDLAFNRYILMHFMKAYRQVSEGCTFEYFYSVIKSGANAKKVYEAFLIDSFISGTTESSRFLFAHDHRCWKLAINENVIKRKIVGNMKTSLYSKSIAYTNKSMGKEAFKMVPLTTTSRDATRMVEGRQSGGYIFRDYTNQVNTFKSVDLASCHDQVFNMLQNKK